MIGGRLLLRRWLRGRLWLWLWWLLLWEVVFGELREGGQGGGEFAGGEDDVVVGDPVFRDGGG